VWALSLAGSPAWSELHPFGPGSGVVARAFAMAIYDPVRDQMVVYGGSGGPSFYNDAWALCFSCPGSPRWVDITPTGGGPAIGRLGHSGIYDPVRDRMVLFSGYDNNGFVGDVWALNSPGLSASWSALAPNWSPPTGRVGHTAIYDPVRDRMVMFGGLDGSSRNDVWELSLAGTPAWREIFPVGSPPTARRFHTAIYDPLRDRMVVFAGIDGSNAHHNDVWALTLTGSPTWSEISPAGSPPSARVFHTAIYDPVRDRMVVFGGSGNGGVANDVWALSLGASPGWSQLSPTGSPPPQRYGHAAIYDPKRDRMVVFGGGDGLRNDAWSLSLDGTPAWSEISPIGATPTARKFHSAIYDPVRDRMMVFGGFDGGARNDVWALPLAESPAWTELSPAGGPPPARYLFTAIYDLVRGRMVVFGGQDAGFRNDTWVLLNPPDTTPPSVTLTSPNGGETLDNATPITITWTASDNFIVAHVDIYVSTNGGSTYSLLAAGEANDGSYAWNGAAPSTQCRARVVAFDGFGNSTADASDGNFTISDPTPPAIPSPFVGLFTGGPVQLHWGANAEGDFASYHLHRGSTAAFVPGPGNLVVSKPDTGYTDAGSTWSYYKLSALDALGHESGFALVNPSGASSGNTPADSNVTVPLGSNVQVTFKKVTSPGQTQLTLQTGGTPPPNGLKLMPSSPPLYYVLSTTATFTGPVKVCVTYDPANVNGQESNLRMMHNDGGWVELPASVNTGDHVICGTVSHFSEFALMEVDPTVDVKDAQDAIPSAFLLYPCAPNPVSGAAQIQYDLPVASPVRLGLFDLQGRLVRELERNASAGAGRHVVRWDGRGNRGEPVRSGIYFLRLDAGTFHDVQRVAVMK
jgi:galactose oxidase-like protein/Big-like domain-containing protein